MKVSKKVKIITAITVISIGIVVMACASFSDKTTATTTINWKKKAPQLFNNAGYSKLIASNPVNKEKLPDSQDKLAGTITNPFGVRDDVLDYIINNVPKDNVLALRAAITLASVEQKIYYGNITQQEALKLSEKESLLVGCLSRYSTKNLDGIQLLRDIDHVLRNTEERDLHMRELDRKYFSWQVLGADMTVDAKDKACAKGEF